MLSRTEYDLNIYKSKIPEVIKQEHEITNPDSSKTESTNMNVIWLNDIKQESFDTCYYDEEEATNETPIKSNECTDNDPLEDANSSVKVQKRCKLKTNNDMLSQEIAHTLTAKVNSDSNHHFYCANCGEECELYCTNCRMLLHILDNNSKMSNDRSRGTIPKFILQINDVNGADGVVALKKIPKGVKFGPFDGLVPIQTAAGLTWKVKGGVLLLSSDNIKYANWMRYVNCAPNWKGGNLSLIQYDNSLYYRSDTEINEGEELLLHFGEEHQSCLNSDSETYVSVVIETELENVYGCTYCCLGFASEVHLARHKAMCLKGIRTRIGTADLIQCTFCKIFLEEKEYTANHVDYCCERYARKYLSSSVLKSGDENGNESVVKYQLQKIYNVVEKKHKCSECSYQSNDRYDLKKHQYRHANIKPFQCLTCNERFTQKGHLKLHMKNKHDAVNDKEYKCRFCQYQTNSKGDLKLHLYVHDAIKRFECEICGKRFRQKANLQVHLKNLHLAVNNKKFACPKCNFRTNYKNSLDKHVNNTHNGPAPVFCHVCNGQFKQIYTLKQHIKYKHATTTLNEKKDSDDKPDSKNSHFLSLHETKLYDCPRCDYRTGSKDSMTLHMYKHVEVKPYSCESCGKAFSRKGAFKTHIRDRHPLLEVV